MPSLLRIATLLGAGPLLLGTLIYGAWRQTRWHWLELAGACLEMGPIGPGERAEEHFHFEGDGALEFSARQMELHFTGEIDGYVTGSMRGNKTVRVRPGGAYTIEATPPN